MRFAMTARTIAHSRSKGEEISDMTAANVAKVTRYRRNADDELEEMVGRFEKLTAEGDFGVEEVVKQKVYPVLERSR